TKEIIGCIQCGRAYRVIPMEFNFLRRIGLPIPRKCPECRFHERFAFANPPKLWSGKCQCNGATSDKRQATRYEYQNSIGHFHGKDVCPNEYLTSYAPGRPEIIYCEQCYQAETA